eukprot:757939-Hanusia_phi.AAC.4
MNPFKALDDMILQNSAQRRNLAISLGVIFVVTCAVVLRSSVSKSQAPVHSYAFLYLVSAEVQAGCG